MPTLDRPRIEYHTPMDLLAQVKRGQLRIPPFQRGFKWESSDVIALFDSILRGFPIGNLLFWRRPAPAAEIRVGPLDIQAPALDSAFWVVDGQQRVTSLVGALAAPDDTADTRFRIHLDLVTAKFHALGARQSPQPHWIPVTRLATTTSLLAWMRDNHDWMSAAHIDVADSAAEAIREYQIPTYVVTTDDEEVLRQIFDRLNDTGKPLSKAEVFHALHSGLAGDRPFDLRAIGAVPAEANFGSLDEQVALRCVLAYRGGDIFRKDFSNEFTSDEDRAETFREVAACLRAAVEFLRGEAGIPHSSLLPYSHVVPVLVRYVKVHGEPTGRAAGLLRRWVWRDAIAGAIAKGISVATIRQAVVAVDDPDPYRAVDALLRGAPSNPDFAPDLSKVSLSQAAAKINLLGLLSAGPRDLLTGQHVDIPATFAKGNPVRSILRKSVIPDTFANRLVAAHTAKHSVSRLLLDAPAAVAASHLVDPKAHSLLASDDPMGFLDRRAELLAKTVRDHVTAMAEWGARDGRSLASMVRSVA